MGVIWLEVNAQYFPRDALLRRLGITGSAILRLALVLSGLHLRVVYVNLLINALMDRFGILVFTNVLAGRMLGGVDRRAWFAQAGRFGVNGRAVSVRWDHLWLDRFVSSLLLICAILFQMLIGMLPKRCVFAHLGILLSGINVFAMGCNLLTTVIDVLTDLTLNFTMEFADVIMGILLADLTVYLI
jgi:hypothetical protein